MVDDRLLENLNRLGFPLMETTGDFDVHQTLADVVNSRDSRLWEGFPVLLANAAQDHFFNYDQVLKIFSDTRGRNDFHALVLLSLALYQYHQLSFLWANQLRNTLSKQDIAILEELKKKIAHDDAIALGNKQLHPARLKVMFNNYFEQDAEKTRLLKQKHEELSLEYALSQLFSAKQKELFKKKLEGLPLSKTEKEYYSRTVKKKVSALANPELHRLAQKLMDY